MDSQSNWLACEVHLLAGELKTDVELKKLLGNKLFSSQKLKAYREN